MIDVLVIPRDHCPRYVLLEVPERLAYPDTEALLAALQEQRVLGDYEIARLAGWPEDEGRGKPYDLEFFGEVWTSTEDQTRLLFMPHGEFPPDGYERRLCDCVRLIRA